MAWYAWDRRTDEVREVSHEEFLRLEMKARADVDRLHRRVDLTKMGDVEVSTVLVGIDVSFGDRSILFETKVFGGVLDGEVERYATPKEAREGHLRMVERVKTTSTR